MRVKMRRVLDVESPVNLRELAPLDKIKAGIVTQWMHTNFYKNYRKRKDEERYSEQVKKDEIVKSLLLSRLYNELGNNNTLKEKDKVCDSIIISIDHDYVESLERLFPALFDKPGSFSKDFLSYDVVRIKENADIRRAFPDMKVLLKFSKKTL